MIIFLASLVIYLVYQGIYLEINKNVNSAPSYTSFIPAALLGIVLAPYIVSLINHFKTLKILKANNKIYNKNIAIPLMVGYVLVIASILLVMVYLVFDGLLMQKMMFFAEPFYAFAIFFATSLLFAPPVAMLLILSTKLNKA